MDITAASLRTEAIVQGARGRQPSKLTIHVTVPRPFVVDDAADAITYGSQRLRWNDVNEVAFFGGRGVVYRGSRGRDFATLSGLASARMGAESDTLRVFGLSGDRAAVLAGGTGYDSLDTPNAPATYVDTTLDLAGAPWRWARTASRSPASSPPT